MKIRRYRHCTICGYELAEARIVNARGDRECMDCGAVHDREEVAA